MLKLRIYIVVRNLTDWTCNRSGTVMYRLAELMADTVSPSWLRHMRSLPDRCRKSGPQAQAWRNKPPGERGWRTVPELAGRNVSEPVRSG